MSTATKKNIVKDEAVLLKQRAAVLESAFQQVENLVAAHESAESIFAACHREASEYIRLSHDIRHGAVDDLTDINAFWAAICTKYGWGDQTAKITGEKIIPSLGTMRSLHRKGAKAGANFGLGWYAFREETTRLAPKGEGRGRGKLKAKPAEKGGAAEGDAENTQAVLNKGTPLQETAILPGIFKALLDGRAGLDPDKRSEFDKAVLAYAEGWLQEARKGA